MKYTILLFALLGLMPSVFAAKKLPLVHRDTFDSGAGAWFPTQASKWKIGEGNGGKVLELLGKSGAYNPPHRSPYSITLLKEIVLGDFVLTAKVRTLQTTRGHRDMCIFFGYQDPAHFYYVHFGETPDPHSSQVFIVNKADRLKITETPDHGIPWVNDKFHSVKVVRRVSDGLIEIYFDDMEKPQKVAHDKTFDWGMIGLGSFDDLGQWDDVEIRGITISGKTPELFTQASGSGSKKKKKKKSDK